MFTAVRHAEFHDAGHFLSKAHTACAMDTTAHLFHADERPGVFVKDNAFFFFVARSRTTVAHRQILQLAFAALVANRAIERMVDQQKLHHRLLRFDRFLAFGTHHHALGHRCCACRHGLGCFFYIDQTHAAVGSDAEFLVITKMRNVSARFFSCMHDHAAFLDFHFITVEFDFNHGTIPSNVRRDHAGLVRDVVFKFSSEMFQHAAHWHGGCVAQSTNRAAHDVFCDVVQQVHIARTAFAAFESIDHAPQPTCAFAARRALAA